ncbi:MAG: PilZ domain-containing protein [Phycisphaerae bacterium]|nr:PilZ domain-containing protein [Phycisphaerae bacterium]
MTHVTAPVESDSQTAVLNWAVEKQVEANISFAMEGRWVSLRSVFRRFDAGNGIIQVVIEEDAPESGENRFPGTGEQVGVSFRRGHKKCLFLTHVVTAQPEKNADGRTNVGVVLRLPSQVRAIQRRAYQRVIVPENTFVAAKIWEGGVPTEGAVAWPVCSGRVANISMGGVLIETRADQNPRLSSGEVVGVEITTRPGESLLLDGMYRHCVMDGQRRLGLGFHFAGIEHELPGRATIQQLSDFVARVRAMR